MKKGWTGKTIADVCDVVNGGTPKTGVARYWGGAHRWITPAEMGRRTSPYVEETDRTLSDAGLANSSANLVPALSVILSSRAPIGHLVINTEPMAFNQGCKGLAPKKDLDHKFLYYYLTSIVAQLNALGTGATFKELSGTKLKSVSIPVPPLPEQRRIVGILDEAFDGIATAKANAEQNLQNARAVFESHLNAVFMERGEGWIQTTVGQQVLLQRGFDITKRQQNSGTIPVVSSGGIRSYHDQAMTVGPGVVIGRKGTLGKVFYLDDDYWPHDTTLWVRDFKGNYPRFVYYFFRTLDVSGLDSGAANPALNRNLVHPIEVYWPPVSDQPGIVSTMDALVEMCEHLQSIYQRKLAGLDELKKSLLHQAFSGQL